MFENYSEQTRRTLVFARYEASKLGAPVIDSEHVLLGVLREEEESFGELIVRLGIRPEKIRWEIEGQGIRIGEIATTFDLPLSEDAQKILELACQEAEHDQGGELRSEHLIFGILGLAKCNAARILRRHGLDMDRFHREVEFRNGQHRGRVELPPALPLLSEFGRDLTVLASRGQFDPLIGRQGEVRRLFRILARRHKNNPILIGEPGVGKTALVEGLAQRIANGESPARFRKRRLYALDLSLIVAGTKYRGQFEERLKGILAELADNPEIIVFIDEVHGLIGAGASEGSLDAANILKPAISRGELACIGATTPREFRRYIEKDRSLLRRFQPVQVEPTEPDKAVEILQGLKDRYEAFHGVEYSDDALRAAVALSHRFIADRSLPDKAIDVVDEAGAWLSLEEDAPGEEPVTVDLDTIEAVVASITGVPVERLQAEDAERLRRIEALLGQWIIGQDAALEAISRAIRRNKTRLGNPRRPIGSFLFLGPSGVGKTEVARRLSEFLFESQRSLVRFDMSEFMERHSVAKLIGSPPGYVGYEDGGQLTERVRRQPYSLILFDEIEKAHPDVSNLLLQVLEDGVLTDAYGREVDFKSSLILMTSNVGSQFLVQRNRVGFAQEGPPTAHLRPEEHEVREELKRTFRPEFLNRFDEVIVFNPLDREALRAIVDLQIEELNRDLGETGARVEISAAARDWLLDHADLDPATGARPLRRTIERHVRDPLSTLLVEHHGAVIERIAVDVAAVDVAAVDGAVVDGAAVDGADASGGDQLTFEPVWANA